MRRAWAGISELFFGSRGSSTAVLDYGPGEPVSIESDFSDPEPVANPPPEIPELDLELVGRLCKRGQLVALAQLLYPQLTACDGSEGDDGCAICAGGALMLTYQRYHSEMKFPPLPSRIQPDKMPDNDELEDFLCWLRRASKHGAGESGRRKRDRREARQFADNIIEANDARNFGRAWELAEHALPSTMLTGLQGLSA